MRFIPSATCFRCHTFERHPTTKNKQLMGKEQKRNGLQTKRSIDTSSVSRSFFFCRKSIAAAVQGIRQTALLQEKSSYPLSVGGAVAVIQHPFDVGFTVENFTAQLDIGDTPFIAVVLKCPAAHLQPCRHLLVSEERSPPNVGR